MIETTYIRKAKSWSEFSSSLYSLIEKNKKLQAGKIYEKCVQLFLQTDPKYQAALKNVWLLQDVPKVVREKLKLPNADEGIDLIAETNQKEYWAIQAKYKSDKSSTLTRKDLATFRDLAFNYCKNIQHGLVCSPISHEPKKSNLMNKMGFALINEWEDLDKDKNKGWKNIQKKLGGKAVKPEKFKPKPHQSKAIKEVIKAFKSNSVERGKMIMPCGTGKSLTAFWITRDMKVNNVLVAIPSLSLLQQTLNVWTKEFLANDIQPNYLCVCSDESAGSLEKDEFTAQTYDLGIPTTTDVDEISAFLKDKNSKFKIIFTTYQSGQATAKASKKAKFTFDIGIMDEAHKTVGHKLKPMAHLLYEKNIKIKKRLFMTATERVYKGGKENEILSMDDPQDYGNTVYQMTYKEAIDAGVVSDYKIVSFNVTDAEYREIIQNNEYIRVNNNPKQNDDVTARELATALALRKTFKKLKISKALSFHSSIRRADKFEELNKQINKDFKKYPSIETYHVSSKQKSSDRVQEMRSFEQSDKSLMTNARCLTEGVDVPAIDCVAFIDSKKSKVDIVQASGRAMRVSKGKEYGYILVPIITNLGDINFSSVDTEYEDLITIISSLATQDERLVDEIKTLNKNKINRKTRSNLNININVLNQINPKKLDEEISIKLWGKIKNFSFMSYEDCRNFARKMKFTTQKEYKEFCDTPKKPIDIPINPHIAYKNRGWISFGEFFGTGRIANQKREFWSFEKARKFVHKLKLKNQSEWIKFASSKKRPQEIPYQPWRTYKDLGFISLGDWLGNDRIADQFKTYLTYEEAKNFAQNFKPKIISGSHWIKLHRDGKIPNNLPVYCNQTYKDKGWEGWPVFLNNNYKRKSDLLTFHKARKLVHKLKLNSSREYLNLQKSNKYIWNLPNYPNESYANSGWKNWKDFIGPSFHKKRINVKEFVKFDDFKKLVNELEIDTAEKYRKYTRSKNFNKKFPKAPDQTYKNDGWTSWLELFNKNFLSYNEAKKIISKYKFKDRLDYTKFTKKNKLKNIPKDTYGYYKKTKQWVSWDDFLGKK